MDFKNSVRLARAANDVVYFGEEILGYTFTDHMVEWVETIDRNDCVLIECSRGHGKSTIVACIYQIHCCAFPWKRGIFDTFNKNPYKPFASFLISHSQGQTIKMMRAISAHFNIDELRHLKPKENWPQQRIDMTNGSTIWAESVGSSIRGEHPPLIICDDILNPKSPYPMSSTIRWFHSDLMGMLDPGAKLVVIGTPISFKDLYVQIKKRGSFVCKQYPAIKSDYQAHFDQFDAVSKELQAMFGLEEVRANALASDIVDDAVSLELLEPTIPGEYVQSKARALQKNRPEVLWPERRTLGWLYGRRKAVGEIEFAREFQVTVMDDSTSLFPMTLIANENTLDRDSILLRQGLPDSRYFTGCDVAVSATGDYTALLTLSLLGDGRKRLSNFYHDKAPYGVQKAEIERISAAFATEVTAVEQDSYGMIFGQGLQNSNVRVKGQLVHDRANKESMILKLRAEFENGKIVFPYGNHESKTATDIILSELNAFGYNERGKLEGKGEHDDCVMALAHAIRAMDSYGMKLSYVESKGIPGMEDMDIDEWEEANSTDGWESILNDGLDDWQ